MVMTISTCNGFNGFKKTIMLDLAYRPLLTQTGSTTCAMRLRPHILKCQASVIGTDWKIGLIPPGNAMPLHMHHFAPSFFGR